ncbi:MAG: hypothetical protein PHQ12_09365 [Chthoniobacteraceae bacterium]|nr:hypothetical protein [Chthoniobacteraceae bacterium]
MSPESRGLAALAAQVEHYRLIFRWPERTASLLLPALFLLSVAVHGLALFVFQVVYPPTVASAPPPAQVTLLTPDTPQGAALLRWMDVQDPAAAARVEEVNPARLGEIAYNPSYAIAQTPLREAESPREPIPFPAAHNLLDFATSTPAPAVPAASPRSGVATSLRFSESLRGREPATPAAPLRLGLKSSAKLRSAIFLVGVGDRGEVRYCFLHESSGDPDMDAQAEALLRQHAFTVSETPLEWGFALFNWGAEAYAPAPHGQEPATEPRP